MNDTKYGWTTFRLSVSEKGIKIKESKDFETLEDAKDYLKKYEEEK